jgi:hypothetical protein
MCKNWCIQNTRSLKTKNRELKNYSQEGRLDRLLVRAEVDRPGIGGFSGGNSLVLYPHGASPFLPAFVLRKKTTEWLWAVRSTSVPYRNQKPVVSTLTLFPKERRKKIDGYEGSWYGTIPIYLLFSFIYTHMPIHVWFCVEVDLLKVDDDTCNFLLDFSFKISYNFNIKQKRL